MISYQADSREARESSLSDHVLNFCIHRLSAHLTFVIFLSPDRKLF